MAAVAALLVERQPNSRVPRRVVRSGSWVARTSQTHAGCWDERDREAGVDKATYFAIRPLPFRREARLQHLFVALVFRWRWGGPNACISSVRFRAGIGSRVGFVLGGWRAVVPTA
jgi:hypothetical protein